MKPTDEELRRAHNRLAPGRPHWPPTFEACMDLPTVRVQVECEARAAAGFVAITRKAEKITHRAVMAKPKAFTGLDLKSRAAGEKEDE